MPEKTVSVERLIRLILEQCNPYNGQIEPEHENSENEQVVLDIEVDSSRYLFIRLPKPTQQAVQLSPREQEIVRLVALGHSNKIIADVLSISSWTVCTHLRRVFSKLGVGSRAAMVARFAPSSHGQTNRRDAGQVNYLPTESSATDSPVVTRATTTVNRR